MEVKAELFLFKSRDYFSLKVLSTVAPVSNAANPTMQRFPQILNLCYRNLTINKLSVLTTEALYPYTYNSPSATIARDCTYS